MATTYSYVKALDSENQSTHLTFLRLLADPVGPCRYYKPFAVCEHLKGVLDLDMRESTLVLPSFHFKSAIFKPHPPGGQTVIAALLGQNGAGPAFPLVLASTASN